MTNRIFSEAYDTVVQKDYYEKKCSGDVNSFVSDLSSKLKSDMIFFGKIVLTDAQFYDSPLLHMMNDNEFSAFKKFVQESDGAIEVRCRSNTLPNMFAKQFRYSSVRHPGLSDALYDIGGTLSENYCNVRNTASSLVTAIKAYGGGRLSGLESEFEEFASRLCKLDELRKDCPQAFIEWGVAVDERAYTQPYFANLPAVMKEKREYLLCRLRYFAELELLEKAKIESVENELRKTSGFPNASVIKTNAPTFFREFRHWYNIGIASQHFADSQCLFDYENLSIGNDSEHIASSNERACVLSAYGNEYEELFKSRWSDFTPHLAAIATIRDTAWGAYKARNVKDYATAIEGIKKYVSEAHMPLVREERKRIESLFNRQGINSTSEGVSTEQTSVTVFNDTQEANRCSVMLPAIHAER
jgi:hypothetical protein